MTALRFAFALLVFFIASALILRDDPARRIADRFVRYQVAFPSEKVFLHLDRPYYSAGETVWFKAYLVDGTNHGVDSASGVLYVELLDAEARQVVQTKTLRVENGYAAGDFLLADTLATGHYQLRAYTNYMRNFGEEFLFTQDFRVFGAQAPAAEPEATGPVDLQFFPEGGQLLPGFDCRVGFKAVGPDGRGVAVRGIVLADDRDTVAAFRSEHLGMGRFSMPVEAGRGYTAVLFNADGARSRQPLPPVQPDGHTLAVDAFGKDAIRVFVFNATPQPAVPRELVLFVQMRGVVCFIAKGNTGRRSFTISVPRAKFPDDGIAHLTLFDDAGNPLAERLVFMRQNRTLKVALQPDKPMYKPREAVKLGLRVTDAEGKPVAGNFSLSVTDAGQVVAEPGARNLVSYLLLSSDLRGNVEQPGHYFDLNNPDAALHLDLLMMTQGWRRFVWKEVLADSLPKPRFLMERGLSVTGSVLRPNGKPFEKKVGLTLMAKTRNALPAFATGEADTDGRFGFYGLTFADTTTLLVQAVAGKGNREGVIRFDPFVAPPPGPGRGAFDPLPLSAGVMDEYRRRSDEARAIERQLRLNQATLLQGVTVKAKKEDPLASRRIYGEPAATLKVDQINSAGALSVLDILRGRVAGVSVNGSFPAYSVTVRGISSLNARSEPLFLLDGMPADLQAILTIPVADVEQIDVLKGPEAAIFGSRGGNGVIAVLTKRGGADGNNSALKAPGVEQMQLPGFAPVREFYAPKYDQPRPEHVRPDFRATLHWAPFVQTDTEGNAIVQFFASDAATTLRLDVQGSRPLGNVGVGEAMFRVEP